MEHRWNVNKTTVKRFHIKQPSARPLRGFARLFLGTNKPLNRIFSLSVLPYLINIDRDLQPQLALCELSRK